MLTNGGLFQGSVVDQHETVEMTHSQRHDEQVFCTLFDSMLKGEVVVQNCQLGDEIFRKP